MEKLHKDILKILKGDDMKTSIPDLKKKLHSHGYPEDVRNFEDHFSGRVYHACDVLNDQGFLILTEGRKAGHQHSTKFVGITSAGRDELKMGFRLWRWFKDEFSAALTIFATTIGLLAFFGIDWSWFKGLFE